MSGSGKPGAEIRSIVLDSAIFPALCFAGGNQRMPTVRTDQLSGNKGRWQAECRCHSGGGASVQPLWAGEEGVS